MFELGLSRSDECERLRRSLLMTIRPWYWSMTDTIVQGLASLRVCGDPRVHPLAEHHPWPVSPCFGLAAWVTVLEPLHLATGRSVYRRLFEFWLRILGVAFGLGVVSGVAMGFQFGTNWSALSRLRPDSGSTGLLRDIHGVLPRRVSWILYSAGLGCGLGSIFLPRPWSLSVRRTPPSQSW